MTARLLWAWLPALAYMALIWIVSSFSIGPLPMDFPLRDKGVHLIEYAALAALLAHATRRTWPERHPLRTASLAILITVLWGLLDEIHQSFVPGRGPDALDLAADALGACAGAATRHALRAVRSFGPAERA